MYWACYFISLDVAMSYCTIFKMYDVHSVCFVNTDLRTLNITCIIYTCTTDIYGSSDSLICMTKFPLAAHSAAHFFIFGSSWLPTELPTELPTVSIYGSSGRPEEEARLDRTLCPVKVEKNSLNKRYKSHPTCCNYDKCNEGTVILYRR